MKTYKTYIRAILPLFVVLGLVGSAQAQATATATASADIATALTLTKIADINFGTVSATTPGVVKLDPTDVTASTNVGSSRTLGEFTVTAANSDIIDLTFDSKVTLTDNNSNNLYLLAEVAGAESTGGPFLSLSSDGTTSFTTSNTGAYVLRVGGELTQNNAATFGSPGNLSGVTTGSYSGTFNASIVYN